MNKLKIGLLSLVVAAATFVGYSVVMGDNTKAATETPECGPNAIVTCGAMTPAELKSKYAANKSGVQAIFGYYSISAADVAASDSAKTGYVDVDGNVKVDGKVVATNAYTVGRNGALGGNEVNANGWTVYEGPDRLKSTLSAYVFFNADGSFKSAVLKVCGNPVKATTVPVPVYSCDLLTPKQLSRTEYQFTTTATAKNGATISGYSYNYGDGTSAAAGATTTHTYAKPGTYAVTATVTFTVNGESKQLTGNCKTSVTIKSEPIQACDLTTNTVITIEKDQFDPKRYSTDLTLCSKVTYCDTATKTIVTVAKNDKKDTYTTDLTKCNTEVCRISDKVVVTIPDAEYQQNKDKYTTDMTKCQPAPAPVPELPKTGMGELMSGGMGAGALTLAAYHYYTSRRML